MKLKRLCPELVTKLGEVKAEIKALKRDESDLIEVAKDTFRGTAGVKKRTITNEDGTKKITLTYSPKRCEYEAVLSEFEMLDVSWRQLFEEQYIEQHGKKGWKKFLKSLPSRKQTQLDINERM